jgi:ABC-type transport system involved in cytochrome c biogenesis permease subunit
MTHGDFPKWLTYLITAAVAVLLLVSWRFGARRIKALVNRFVPPRFDPARQALELALMVIYSLAVAILTMLVILLVLYAVGYA